MKSLLKIIGAMALSITPTMGLVACGTSTAKVSDQDILNQAVETISDSTIAMKAILGLSDFNSFKQGGTTGLAFDALNSNIKTKITNFFQAKVTQNSDTNPNSNWFYPSAHVELQTAKQATDPTKDEVFNDKFNGKIYGTMLIQAKITFKSLPTVTKNITLTVDNDLTSNKTKTEQMVTYFKTIVGSIIIKPQSLPLSGDNITTDNVDSQLRLVTPFLNTEIKKQINYSNLTLRFNYAKDLTSATAGDKTLFTFTKPPANATTFIGTLKNITITFMVGSDGITSWNDTSTPDPTPINVQQNLADASTQITNMFNTWTDTTITTVPKDNDSYATYVATPDGQEFLKQMQDYYFATINKYYPVSEADWTGAKTISVTNPDTKFVALDAKNGSFKLSIKFSFDFKNWLSAKESQKIEFTTNEITINLRQK